MSTSQTSSCGAPDFFRSRLDAMIDLRHPLAVLATRMPWRTIEATLAPLFERRTREALSSTVPDLFGMAPKLAGAGVSVAGGATSAIAQVAATSLAHLPTASQGQRQTVCTTRVGSCMHRQR